MLFSNSKLSKSESLTESGLRTKKVPSAKQPLASAKPCFSVPVAKLPILQEGFGEANPSESRHKNSKGQKQCTKIREAIVHRFDKKLEASIDSAD
ncbi:hypothetical protein M5K25_016726 [Dendrobium thyrsiflorum]|uniref:Uncharacterized protein n=1 Tax=Dendrobium thyrsiflorum TaxID=117978 RepID=A0ABD0UKJ6_DENTH